MFLLHAGKPGFFLSPIQSCHLPIDRLNKSMHQKDMLNTWNKIAHRAGTLLVLITRHDRFAKKLFKLSFEATRNLLITFT